MVRLPLLVMAFLSTKTLWTIDETVDVLELNHVYNKEGRLVFSQLIFWEIDPRTGGLLVRAWTMADQPSKWPLLGADGLKAVRWMDCNVYRNVRGKLFHESWTHIDRERDNLKILCSEDRVGLASSPDAEKIPRVFRKTERELLDE